MTKSQENLDFYLRENITCMAFEHNLIRIRELLGKKPMDVVRGTGINKQQYYAYEAGEYKPGEDNLDLLSSYFNVPKMLFFKETITENDVMELNKSNNEDEWYRQTIAALIRQNGETIKVNNETITEFRQRDKKEINSLKMDKTKLWDLLSIHLKPPQNGQ